MKNKIGQKVTLMLMLISASAFGQKTNKSTLNNTLWYAQPAEKWMQALPVGNGRLGAMVFGDPNKERIQLNEDSMWAGGPDWGDSKGTEEDLVEIRKLVKNGKAHKADKLIVEKFSYKSIKRSHQTMGNLFIDFIKDKKIENYKRSLDMDKALVKVSYTSDGNSYSEKVFSSAADDVMVVELSTSAKEGMNFNLQLSRPEDHKHKTVSVSNPANNEISMTGMVTQYGGIKFSEPFPIDYGVKFETLLKVKNYSGTVTSKNGTLQLRDVKKATILIMGNTSFYYKDFKQKNRQTLTLIENKYFDNLLERHINNYQKLFKRLDFDLEGHALDTVATDKRLKNIRDGADDPDMTAKLFQYGRYLLISSSRPGTNPANLQGIWNKNIEAPWNADYHLNINLQMNYWPAEVTNLSELHEPFFDLLDRVEKRGRITAKKQYGINRGAVMHHATDLWAPAWMRAEQPFWGAWVHGGGWTAQHYWEHFQYTQDKDFLKNRAYPFMKSIAEFYLDWLVWDEKTKTWVSSPETSPENSYIAEDKRKAAVSFGSAMGHQIITEVFDNVIAASKILGYSDDFIKEVKRKREKLHPGVIIGKDGRILEWNEPYDEPEKGHRHMSHMYALHPSDQITIDKNPKEFEAAKKTIAYRLKHGGAGTGWSRVWMINLNARLFENEKAEDNIKKFFQKSVADNMFDMHPPFQIDGNFGFTAGVAELLMQSHEGFIRILPTFPSNWKNGKISGLKARGNIEVSIEWEDNMLVKLGLTSAKDKTIKIIYNSIYKNINLKANQTTWLNNSLIKL